MRSAYPPSSGSVTVLPSETAIIDTFQSYAYEPEVVYTLIVVLMLASSFGLPFPEELTLLSAGLLAHMGSNPALYPPPTPDASGVSIPITACVCFTAVLASDLLVYWLGRRFGTRVLTWGPVKRLIKPGAMAKITSWTERYGSWAVAIFRFTPGLRFPGHLACGMLGIAPRRFLAIDGAAVLLSVPTQVLLMAYFGDAILSGIKSFKIGLVGLLLAGFTVYVLRRLWLGYRLRKPRVQNPQLATASAEAHPVVMQTSSAKAETARELLRNNDS